MKSFDDTTAISLDLPVTAGGQEYATLAMRRPRQQDQELAAQRGSYQETQEVELFALLCDVTGEVIGLLDNDDYGKLQTAFLDFLDLNAPVSASTTRDGLEKSFEDTVTYSLDIAVTHGTQTYESLTLRRARSRDQLAAGSPGGAPDAKRRRLAAHLAEVPHQVISLMDLGDYCRMWRTHTDFLS